MITKRIKFNDRYGKWAVVTGASDGIGRAIAVELASQKLNLVLVARRIDLLKQLSLELSKIFSTETVILEADLSTDKGISHLKTSTVHLDIGLYVAAAGFGTSGRFLKADIKNEMSMLD
jgi:short-subunit dehydrogenase